MSDTTSVTPSVPVAPQCAKKPGTVLLKPVDLLHTTEIDPDIEEDIRYGPGGYHPIIIGDILGGSPQRQYRIVHKLGSGSYSTVWLAQRTDLPNAFVSLKITTADDGTPSQEVQMLQKVAWSQWNSYRDCDGRRCPVLSALVWTVTGYGLAQALAQLHADQIVHGDLHIENIGIAMPQLAHQDHKAVLQDLSDYDITVVLTYDPSKQTASLPAYLIAPCKLGAYYRRIASTEPPQVKILDFGSAHEIGTHPHTLQCAVPARAPEIVFAQVFQKIDNPSFDPPADVWALGATIYEIVTGGALFRGVGMTGLPSRMATLGRVPPYWKKWTAEILDTDEGPLQWDLLRLRCENDEDTNALVRLLKAVLVLDPAERPTTAEITKDPWFHTVNGVNNVQ